MNRHMWHCAVVVVIIPIFSLQSFINRLLLICSSHSHLSYIIEVFDLYDLNQSTGNAQANCLSSFPAAVLPQWGGDRAGQSLCGSVTWGGAEWGWVGSVCTHTQTGRRRHVVHKLKVDRMETETSHSFTKKMLSHQYMNFYYKDKTALWWSYICNGNTYTRKDSL